MLRRGERPFVRVRGGIGIVEDPTKRLFKWEALTENKKNPPVSKRRDLRISGNQKYLNHEKRRQNTGNGGQNGTGDDNLAQRAAAAADNNDAFDDGIGHTSQ